MAMFRAGMAVVVTLVGAMGMAAAPGCLAVAAGAAAGVGTYAYIKGELKTTLEASIDKTWDATQRSIEQLGFAVKEAAKDAMNAKMSAREADGTDVVIFLARKGDNLTEVRVRVGFFGDEGQSRLILDKIKQNL